MNDIFMLVASVFLLHLVLKALIYACKNKVILHQDKNISYKESKVLFILSLLFLTFLLFVFVSQIFDSLYILLKNQ